jgi:hypothetical protein
MAQRAVRQADLDLILLVGTEVADGYLVRERDCRDFEVKLKELARQVHRLRGKRVVVSGDRVVTVYDATPSTKRRLLRGTEQRSMTE